MRVHRRCRLAVCSPFARISRPLLPWPLSLFLAPPRPSSLPPPSRSRRPSLLLARTDSRPARGPAHTAHPPRPRLANSLICPPRLPPFPPVPAPLLFRPSSSPPHPRSPPSLAADRASSKARPSTAAARLPRLATSRPPSSASCVHARSGAWCVALFLRAPSPAGPASRFVGPPACTPPTLRLPSPPLLLLLEAQHHLPPACSALLSPRWSPVELDATQTTHLCPCPLLPLR